MFFQAFQLLRPPYFQGARDHDNSTTIFKRPISKMTPTKPIEVTFRPFKQDITTANHGATESQFRHCPAPQLHSPQTGGSQIISDIPLSSTSGRPLIIEDYCAYMDPLTRQDLNTNGATLASPGTLPSSRRRNTTSDTTEFSTLSSHLAQPTTTLSAATAPATSSGESTGESNTYSPHPVPTQRRGLHKKPRSYDLRDDFTHDAPAARAALETFHSRQAQAELHASAGGASSPKRKTTQNLASSEPQLHQQKSFETRPESRSTRPWATKGGQLLH